MSEDHKDEIVDVALQLFLSKGIQSVTMKQLVEKLGVSTKTIYKLFSDKAELLKLCLNLHYASLFTELSTIVSKSENEMEAFLRIIDRTVELEFAINPQFYRDLNKYYPDIQSSVMHMQSKSTINWNDIIERGKQNGLFRPEIDHNVFWLAFQHLYSAITRENIFVHLDLSEQQLIKNTVLVYLRGICTPHGSHALEEYLKSQTFKIL